MICISSPSEIAKGKAKPTLKEYLKGNHHLDALASQAERQRETDEEITYETKANNARKED